QGANGALQHRSERHIERVAFLLQNLRAFFSLLPALFGKVHVRPAGEPVFLVPRAFAVANHHQLNHWRNVSLPGKRAAGPSLSSMRSNWLYLAMRSVRLAEPVLI